MGRGAPRPLALPRGSGHIPPMAKHPTDNPADPFKKALAEATRVLADDPDLGVTYSVDPPGLSGDSPAAAPGKPGITPGRCCWRRGEPPDFQMALARQPGTMTSGRRARYRARRCAMARDTDGGDGIRPLPRPHRGARTCRGPPATSTPRSATRARRKGLWRPREASDALAVRPRGLPDSRHLATGATCPPRRRMSWELWRGFHRGPLRREARRSGRGAARPARPSPASRGRLITIGLRRPAGRGPRRAGRRGRGRGQRRAGGADRPRPARTTAGGRGGGQPRAVAGGTAGPEPGAGPDGRSGRDGGGRGADMPEGEAPLEPPAPAPHSEADPGYAVFTTSHDEGDRPPRPCRGARAGAAARLSRPAAGAAEGRGQPPCQQAAAPPARRSRTAAGNSTARKASSMRWGRPLGPPRAWWRTRRRRCSFQGREGHAVSATRS